MIKGLLQKVRAWFVTSRYEYLAPITLKGIDYCSESSSGDYITYDMIKDNMDDYRKEWFASYFKIILGVNPIIKNEIVDNGRGCNVIWFFNIDNLLNKRLISARLNIKTSRANTGLHTSKKLALQALRELSEGKRKYPRYAQILINDIELDNISILSKMDTTLSDDDFPIGLDGYKDYGFNRIEPYDIAPFIRIAGINKKLKVEICVDEYVYWDIDELYIDNIVYEKNEMSSFFWMITGALISALIGRL